MMRLPRRFAGSCQGATSIEFAMLGGLFMLLCLFILELGMVFLTKRDLQAAAVQAARCAAITSPLCLNPRSYAAALLDGSVMKALIGTPVIVVETGSKCGNAAGQFSKVTLKAEAGHMQLLLPLFSDVLLSASACYPSAS